MNRGSAGTMHILVCILLWKGTMNTYPTFENHGTNTAMMRFGIGSGLVYQNRLLLDTAAMATATGTFQLFGTHQEITNFFHSETISDNGSTRTIKYSSINISKQQI